MDKKNRWIINSKEEAVRAINGVSGAYLGLAIIDVIASFFLNVLFLLDAFAFAIFAFLLRKTKSVIVAVVLLLLSLLSFFSTIKNFSNAHGGRNLLLASFILIIGIRGVQATLKYRKYKTTE